MMFTSTANTAQYQRKLETTAATQLYEHDSLNSPVHIKGPLYLPFCPHLRTVYSMYSLHMYMDISVNVVFYKLWLFIHTEHVI